MRPLLRAVVAAILGSMLALVFYAPVPISAQEIMPTPTPSPSPTPTPTPPGFVKVIVPGSATSASTHDGNVPANAVDGSLGTRWSGFGNGAWLQLDFGVTRHVRFVKIGAHLGNQRRNSFEIHVSKDTMSWTPVFSASTSGTTTQLETFNFPSAAEARYLRYVGRGNSDPTKSGWNSVTELEAYAYPNGPPAAPTNLRAQPDAGRVTLTWNAQSASQFRIFRRLSQCDTYTQVGTSNATTFTDSTVVDRRHYYYYVEASNSGGTSPPSDPIAVTPQIQPPPAPTGLTAVAGPVDSGRIDLSWNAVTASPVRYTIKRALYRGPSCHQSLPVPIATVNAPATTFTDATAEPGTGYLYVVSASNITGEGPSSEGATVTAPSSVPPPQTPTPTPCPTGTPVPTVPPPTETPGPPTQVTIEEGIGRVKLGWVGTGTFPNHSKRYSVFRAAVSCGPYVQIARELPSVSYIDSGLANDTAYFYFVVGTNERGDSLDSATVGATPRHIPPPVPSRPTVQSLFSGSLRVSWTSVFAADSITVKRSGTSGGPYGVVATLPSPASNPATTYTDSAVAAGNAYYYVVEAVNAAGPSGNSPEAPGTVPGGSVGAPTGLVATSGTASIQLSWSAVANATGYRVYRADSRCSPFVAIADPTETTFVNFPGGNRRYLYRVTALSGSTESDPSAIASATPGLSGVPAPTLAVTGGASIQLSWSPMDTATGYHIYRQLPYGTACRPATPELLQTVAPTTRSFNDTVVSPGMQYQYFVRASVGGWPGPMSSGVSGTVSGTNEFATPRPTPCPTSTPTPTPLPPSGPLTPPTSVTAEAGDRQVHVSWGNSSGAYSYRVYRATAACGPFAHVGGRSYWETTPVIDVGLTNGVTYYYLVVATGQQGEESAEPPIVSAMPGPHPPSTWPRVVLGAPGDTRAQIQWSPVYGATSYFVKRSTDRLNYTPVGTSSIDTFVDAGLTNGTNYWYQVAGANASGEGPSGSTFNPVKPRENYIEVTPAASGVTSSTHDGNVPANTVDNNLATRWSGNGNGAWVQFDLGERRVLGYLTIAVYQGNQRSNVFEIHTSSDGVNFSAFTGYRSSGTTLAEERYDIPPVRVRYVRYVGRYGILASGNTTSWNSVTEVSIFAEPAVELTPTPTPVCSTPPPTPTVGPPPSNVTTIAGDRQITVTWSSSYHRNRVLRSTTAGGPYQVVADLSGSAQGSYVDTGLVNGTRYYYVVHIYDQRTSEPGCPAWTWTLTGPYSAEVSAVPQAPGSCAAWAPPPGFVADSSIYDPATDPRNLFDNNLSTRWSANGDGAYFQVDLGVPRTLCSFSMAVYQGTGRKQIFDLQVSSDGMTWTTVLANARSSGTTLQQEPYDFPDVVGRWVRWVGHGNVSNTGTPGTWNSVTEVDFFVR